MYVVTPSYEVIDDKIILEGGGPMDYFYNDFLKRARSYEDGQVVKDEDMTISFTIVSDDEIYPNFDVGCVFGYEDYQKGYTSYVKEK